MADISYNFGGPIATAHPVSNPALVLAWDLFGGEIEAIAHDRPLGIVGECRTARAFKAFAGEWITRAMEGE